MNLEATTSARRYPAAAAHRARELREAGFSLSKVGELIGREFGAQPSDSTLMAWTSDGYAARRYKRREHLRVAAYTGRRGASHHSTVARYARLVALRDAGLGFRSVAVVLNLDYGDDFTEDQIRAAIRRGRYPKTPTA